MFLLKAPAWHKEGSSLLVRECSACKVCCKSKIAGFDLNDTLVTSKIGAPGYSLTIADWQYYNDSVAPRLRQLHEDGYKLVIFTNQGNIRSALDGKRAQAVKAYIDDLLKDLALPILVLVATQRDHFRKPAVGMWEFLEKKANGSLSVDRASSFYVGDAAGGIGEHSADDADFAKAVQVRFTHVREFFGAAGGGKGAAPSAYPTSTTMPVAKRPRLGTGIGLAATAERGGDQMPETGKPIVLVLVGAPGCGKSTFAERLGPPAPAGPRAKPRASGSGLTGREAAPWRRVCQDLLGSQDACFRAAERCLQQNFSVIIDRTNFSRDQRKPWLTLAAQFQASCHCLALDVEPEECCRRVAQRSSHEGNLTGPQDSIVMKLWNLLEPISAEENFDRVCLIGRLHSTQVDAEAERYAARGILDSMANATVESIELAVEAAANVTAAIAARPGVGAGDGVSRLAALGFREDQCAAALEAVGGDLDRAADRLLTDRLLGD